MLLNEGYFALKSTQEPRHIILAFRGENAFLSNFQPCKVALPAEPEFGLPAMEFDSTEKAYMAWKTLDHGWRDEIQKIASGDAKEKAHGDGFPIRPGYSDEGRIAIMRELNLQKYSSRNPELLAKLLATGEAVLVEGNTWGDTFFGFSFDDGWGHNHLGRILMQVRVLRRKEAHEAA